MSAPGSVVGIATGYGLDGPEIESRWEARFSEPDQTGPWAHPASCTMGARSFQGMRSARGVTLTPHPLLVPWSRKSRAIPLFPLWTVRPVQSLSACTWVHFTFTLLYKWCLGKMMFNWRQTHEILQLIPQGRVLLEKLIVPRLLKIFPAFYPHSPTPPLIRILTATQTQSTSSKHITLRPILILSY